MDNGNSTPRRPRVFTWHVHGGYLYYLTRANCDFYLPVNEARSHGYSGKICDDPLGDHVHEVPIEQIKDTEFDVIVMQNRRNYEGDQYEILSPEQRQLPKIMIEHDPPCEHPTDTRHFVTDPSVTLVHVTHYNRLMWDSGNVPTTVIEHGVVTPEVHYQGTLERGIVVINNLHTRGRRLGADIFEAVRREIPLDLVGLGTQEIGGLGPIRHDELPEFLAQYRFFFNPIRYTSLGLAIIEAMMAGVPVVGLATTELASVITPGVNGFVSLEVGKLTRYMRHLLESPEAARSLGERGRVYAQQRFSIGRFAHDWERLIQSVCSHEPTTMI